MGADGPNNNFGANYSQSSDAPAEGNPGYLIKAAGVAAKRVGNFQDLARRQPSSLRKQLESGAQFWNGQMHRAVFAGSPVPS